jgi:hypothetical protein
VTGCHSEDRRVATGILRICDLKDDEYNWVNVINPTNTPVNLSKNDILGFHEQMDMLTTPITPLASDTIGEPCATELTDDEVNSAIEGLPHLKNLDLTNITGHTTPLQHMQIKRVDLKHHRLWDTSPKTSPPEVTACDVKIRDGERFTGQGRYVPTNPATRVTIRNLIEDKLKRGFIEPSKSPSSSTVLMVPKPGGGVRFCINYRALNKAIEIDAYTLPTVQEILAALSGDKKFTCHDTKEAFWSAPLTHRRKGSHRSEHPTASFSVEAYPWVFARPRQSIVALLIM